MKLSATSDNSAPIEEIVQLKKILFVETGFGCDQHGQDPTKAAVRACRNAIEFNSIPCIRDIIPGGRENMILRVQVAVPESDKVDVSQLRKVFPYGKMMPPEITEGGMKASSGIAIPELNDKNDQMYIAVAVVTVGY